MSNNCFKRTEMKYRVNSEQRAALEATLEQYMVPDSHGESTICNIYYDTPDFRLIRKSIEKPVYKEKIRLRSYGPVSPDGSVFLELKKKYKGIVYKRRISLKESEATAFMSGQAALPGNSQIEQEIAYFKEFYHPLVPAVYLCYDRTAYFSQVDPTLRITFDQNIRFRTHHMSLQCAPSGTQLLNPRESILEIKATDALPVWLVDELDRLKIRKNAYSKYGSAYQILMQDQPR